METKRSKAIEKGDMYYDTGKECKYGHLSKRMTVDGSCMKCRELYQKNQRELIRQRISRNAA